MADSDDQAHVEAERLRRRLDRMVEAGRVTPDEAERVRSAAPGEVDDAVRDLRLRHARERLDADVRDGRVSRDEADLVLRRLQAGEHRGLLGGVGRRDRSAAGPAPGASPPGEGGGEGRGDRHG